MPDLLRKNFGAEIVEIMQNGPVAVRGHAGSFPAVFAAELFHSGEKNILFIACVI